MLKLKLNTIYAYNVSLLMHNITLKGLKTYIYIQNNIIQYKYTIKKIRLKRKTTTNKHQ